MRKIVLAVLVAGVPAVVGAAEGVRLGVKTCYRPALFSPEQRQAEYREEQKKTYGDVDAAKLEELAADYLVRFSTADPVYLDVGGWTCHLPYQSGRLVVLPERGDDAIAKWDLEAVQHSYGNPAGGQFQNTSFLVLIPRAEFAALLAAHPGGVRLKLVTNDGKARDWKLSDKDIAKLK